jgi:hypothetical protein
MKYRQDFSLYKRHMKNGRYVYYYRTYDEYGQRTQARSTGKTSRTLAERYCHELMKKGELVPTRELHFADYSRDWWIWDRWSTETPSSAVCIHPSKATSAKFQI